MPWSHTYRPRGGAAAAAAGAAAAAPGLQCGTAAAEAVDRAAGVLPGAPDVDALRARARQLDCNHANFSFIHIPKTAGRELERMFRACCGLEFGQSYDMLRWEFTRQPEAAVGGAQEAAAAAVLAPLLVTTSLNVTRTRKRKKSGGYHPNVCTGGYSDKCCSWWHVPPKTLVQEWRPLYEAPVRFCVVRHPVSRLLSEYGFRINFEKPRHRVCPTTPAMFAERDRWIQGQIHAYAQGNLAFQRSDCHLLPQSMYVSPNINAKWLKRVWGGSAPIDPAAAASATASRGAATLRCGSSPWRTTWTRSAGLSARTCPRCARTAATRRCATRRCPGKPGP